MQDSLDQGIYVQETPSQKQSIEWAPTSVTAFVGRTRRGPVNDPTTVHSFPEYERLFGGLWVPSTLSYAVQHFFEYGGETAIIVRVIRGGRCATVDLPAGIEILTLVALHPGASEVLRVAVDYDNIDTSETDLFNLTIQRVTAHGSNLVEDQEIFNRVSTLASADNFVKDRLLESNLVRVAGRVPLIRPNQTGDPLEGTPLMYVRGNTDGHDGAALVDEDLIGSARHSTGMFALKKVESFNILCMPPLSRTADVGVTASRFAARFCEQRGAILLIDPRRSWKSAADVAIGLRELRLSSANAAIYFPRLRQRDPVLDDDADFAPCGVVAGIIARTDRKFGVWKAPAGDFARVRASMKLARELAPREYAQLATLGVNCIRWFGAGKKAIATAHTLCDPEGPLPAWKYLPGRRLGIFLKVSIQWGTKWALFEPNDPTLWAQLRLQVGAFMHRCFRAGAFSGSSPQEAYYVKCDAETTTPNDIQDGVVNIRFGFAPFSPGEFVDLTVTQRVLGRRASAASPPQKTA